MVGLLDQRPTLFLLVGSRVSLTAESLQDAVFAAQQRPEVTGLVFAVFLFNLFESTPLEGLFFLLAVGFSGLPTEAICFEGRISGFATSGNGPVGYWRR